MPQFKILHGSIKTLSGWLAAGKLNEDGSPADLIDLDEVEAKRIDPDGKALQLKSEFDLEQLGEAAKKKAIEDAMAQIAAIGAKAKADAMKPADAKPADAMKPPEEASDAAAKKSKGGGK